MQRDAASRRRRQHERGGSNLSCSIIMEVRMEQTEGLGRQAEVWVDGHLLCVCDGVSAPDARAAPGVLEDVKFEYMGAEGFSWAEAVRGNPAKKRTLEPLGRWSYVGYGQVMSIMPVVIDFGLVVMEDANWTTDEKLVAKFVRIAIDRLEITRATDPDWPEGMR